MCMYYVFMIYYTSVRYDFIKWPSPRTECTFAKVTDPGWTTKRNVLGRAKQSLPSCQSWILGKRYMRFSCKV